jgi:2-oxoisovalerate dehydrogenase E1 component alpha subunit
VDGTDVPATYAACKAAVARARAGEGPTFIEARIWRINAHTSEDNQARYRTEDELREASSHDPLVRFETWLAERGWLSPEEAKGIREACEREAAEAADWAERQPDPRPEDVEANVFGT